jgi:uncharacterized membrane protein (TIGR02234 family)
MLKYGAILLLAIAGGLGVLAATQNWYVLHLAQAAGHPDPLPVPGSHAAPALTALSLAGLALAGALALAGRLIRIVLAVLAALLGLCVLISAIGAMSNPAATGIAVVTKATGVGGDAQVVRLISSVDASAWPVVAVVSGALFVLLGVAVVVTGSRWPGTSHRYEAVRLAPSNRPANARDAAIDDWDELTRGDDPTDSVD